MNTKIESINLENVQDFLEPVNSLEELKTLKLYKTLNVSPVSFFILRYIFNKYVIKGEAQVFVADLLKNLSESSTFEFILTDKERKIINVFEEEEEMIIDSSENNSSNKELINQQMVSYNQYNEIDELEDRFFSIGYMKYVESIYELLKFGYIQTDSVDLSNINIYNLYTTSFVVTLDFLNIVNNGTLDIQEFNNKKPFPNYQDFLKEAMAYISKKHKFVLLQKKLDKKSPILQKEQKETELLEKQFKKRISKSNSFENPMILFFEKNNISDKQKDIFYALYNAEINPDYEIYVSEDNLPPLFFEGENPIFTSKEEKLFFLPEDFIGLDFSLSPQGGGSFGLIFYYLKDEVLDIFQPDSHKDKKVSLSTVQKLVKNTTDFEIIEPNKEALNLILSEDTEKLVNNLSNQLDNKVYEKLLKWGIKKNNNLNARILFSGVPGTGKTATSHYIANKLDKYILSFDCSKILSMYVGESEKNVKLIFDTYRKVKKELNYSPILLLNEADQFLSKRSTENHGTDKMHNQMQNIFLEEFENFEGILIATTNLVENIDAAFSRRFNHKLTFELPNRETRELIWKSKIPKSLPLDKNFDFTKLSSYELSGAQIEVIINNTAIHNAVNNISKFSTENFIEFIEQELKSSFDKSGKSMGFKLK